MVHRQPYPDDKTSCCFFAIDCAVSELKFNVELDIIASSTETSTKSLGSSTDPDSTPVQCQTSEGSPMLLLLLLLMMTLERFSVSPLLLLQSGYIDGDVEEVAAAYV